MAMLTTTGSDTYLLNIGDGENRFSPQWLDEINAALDVVEAKPAPLVTHGTGKFYSNGLDLEWLGANPAELGNYVVRVESLFARVLGLGVPTVAAINGHAFGAGAMIAMAHDWRVMRADRGYFCFPEVDIQIPFTTGMATLLTSKLAPRAAVEAMTTGRRFGGQDAFGAGLVDAMTSEDELVDRAVELLADLHGKPFDTLRAIKAAMYSTALANLASPDS